MPIIGINMNLHAYTFLIIESTIGINTHTFTPYKNFLIGINTHK